MRQSRRIPGLLLGGVLLLITPTVPAQDTGAPEAWPEQDLARFVFEHLDISSFRNSTGPRRGPGQRLFADLGVQLTRVTETQATSDDGGWAYVVRILGKDDYNKDGVDEVLICFHDIARDGGSYNTTQHLVVQLVESRAVALAHSENSLAEGAGCGASDR